jgi:hypothetical protein
MQFFRDSTRKWRSLDSKDSSLNREGNNVKGPHASHTNKGSREKQPGRKPRSNRDEMGLGRPAWADRPSALRARFGTPFSLGVCLFIASFSVCRHIEQINLPTPFTRKPPPQDEGESWMSSSQGSTPVEGRKQEEDSKPLA